MLDRLKELCLQYVEFNEAEITEDTDLRADLGLNSLELANLVVALEDEFGIEIPDRAAMGFMTVGDVANYLKDALSF